MQRPRGPGTISCKNATPLHAAAAGAQVANRFAFSSRSKSPYTKLQTPTPPFATNIHIVVALQGLTVAISQKNV